MDPTSEDAFGLYQPCISGEGVAYLQRQAQIKIRRSIYTAQVVIWLMILQRWQPRGSLATSVEALWGERPMACWTVVGAPDRSGSRAPPGLTVAREKGCRSDYAGR